jgi:hypothetical protein
VVPIEFGISVVPAVEWLVDQVTTTRSHGAALHEAMREAQREARDAQAEVKAHHAWAAEVADFHAIGPDPERDVYSLIALRLRSTVDERDQLLVRLANEQDAVRRIKTQLVNEQARLRETLAAARKERDTVSNMLDQLINAATRTPLHTGPLLRIAAAAREVLQREPHV